MRNRHLKHILSTILIFCILISSFLVIDGKVHAENLYQGDIESAIIAGMDYLRSKMNADGGIQWMDESASMAATIKVVQALAAGGYEQDHLISDTGNRPIDYLANNAENWVNQEETEDPAFSVTRAGQVLTAIAAANENPHGFGKNASDLIYDLRLYYDPNTGVFGRATTDNVMDQVWAMLGLASNNASIPLDAVEWLAEAQLEDGSWNDGFGSFLDTTPLGIMALLASGHRETDAPTVQSAVVFMMENQQPDGGWQTEWDTTTNANTTGIMLQAISSLNQLSTGDNWQKTDGNPHSALLDLQQENGAIGGDFANTYSTADAIVGLSGQTLYRLGYLPRTALAFDFIFTQQRDHGGWEGVLETAEVILALDAAGWDPASVVMENGNPADYLISVVAPGFTTDLEVLSKVTIAAITIGLDPTDVNGTNLSEFLMSTYSEESAAFGEPTNSADQAYGILGLHAAGHSIPEAALETLIGLQDSEGGWRVSPDYLPRAETTALAIQALLTGGFALEDEILQDALTFMRDTQTPDGGWISSDSNSFGIMVLNALEAPQPDWETDLSHTPMTSLFTYQDHSGAFVNNWEKPNPNVLSTARALLAAFSGDYIAVQIDPPSADSAGLVIDPGQSQAETACVILDDPPISGFDLLNASGFSYNAPEGFIESILDISNPTGETNYWSYWHWNGKAWEFYNIGAGETEVLPGSIEAWHFTSWEIFPSLPPDVVPDMSTICDVTIPKNYQIQPFLNYNDLFKKREDQPTEVEPVLEVTEEKPAPILEPIVEDIQPAQDNGLGIPFSTLLPFALIGVGLVIVILIIILILRRRS